MKTGMLPPLMLLGGLLPAQDDPRATELWSPVPPAVSTSSARAIPSDAIVLFDGNSLAEWTGEWGGEPSWTIDDGILTIKAGGGIVTKRDFGDCQLHIEWRAPLPVKGEGQGRGNSGVFLQRRYEVQILDSHDNPTYVNGQAGAIYKQHAPLVNASRPPGEWQVYDIIFRAPRFGPDGALLAPARITVLHNGVLIQNHVEVKGATVWSGRPAYEAHPFRQPLLLQDHGDAVSFRTIWLRELDGE